jgi:UDP-N-acetyl-D-glucosamine dehydrogenase
VEDEDAQYRARFIELAAEINAEMPHHVVTMVATGLNERERSVKGSDILVLGVAYKANVSDVRESPALDIIGLLQNLGARVSYSDPHVPRVETPRGPMMSEPLTADRLARADCVIVATDHHAFDYDLIARSAHLVVDTRNSIKLPPNCGATLIKL